MVKRKPVNKIMQLKPKYTDNSLFRGGGFLWRVRNSGEYFACTSIYTGKSIHTRLTGFGVEVYLEDLDDS